MRPGSLADQIEPLSREARGRPPGSAGSEQPEIANALSLSVRTVESHLYAAYAKLGLTARDELHSAFVESVA